MVDKMVAQPTIHFPVIGGGGELCAGSGAREEGGCQANIDFLKEPGNAGVTQKIGSSGMAAASPPCLWRRTSTVHMLKKRATREGKWNYSTRAFNKVNSDYVRYPCSNCRKLIRTYCSCDPGAPLCSICFGLHSQEHGN